MLYRNFFVLLPALFVLASCSSIFPSAPESGPAETYYLDSVLGMDTATGTNPESAWQTLDRLKTAKIKAGDTILFKRGSTFRGQLVPVSGDSDHQSRYAAYGSGPKPLLLGSINKSQTEDWIQVEGALYSCDQTSPYDIGNLIFDDEAQVGVKKWSLGELSKQGDYYYDNSSSKLYLYSQGNPASMYSKIECALDRFIINQSDKSYLLIEDLDLRYGGANAIGGGNTSNIHICNCDFSYIGGALLYTGADGSKIRYGNGVEFQRNAHDNLVENCQFNQIYDTAVTNQSNATVVKQYNIVYRNNLIRNSGMASVEIWVRVAGSKVYDIIFENNSCYNAGGGWAGTQNRHSPLGAGHHVTSFGSASIPERIYIRNNIFHTAINPDPSFAQYASAIFIQTMPGQSKEQANFTFQNNCYFNNGSYLAIFLPSDGSEAHSYVTNDANAYQSGTGQDANSIFADPLWQNLEDNDFTLQINSPCKNAGLDGLDLGVHYEN